MADTIIYVEMDVRILERGTKVDWIHGIVFVTYIAFSQFNTRSYSQIESREATATD